MTSDLATTNGAAPVVLNPPSVPGSSPAADAMARLAEWVDLGNQAHGLVSRLAGSAFIPAAYRTGDNNSIIANATAAVLYGLSLGWDPMTSLQQVYIVHGRPGLYAKAKVALLQARGFEVKTVELADDVATVAVRRPGQAEFDTPVTVTMKDAERAGWTKNEAYKKTPSDMLWARAAGRACDRSGAAVLLGIATVEEIQPEPARVEATVGAPVRTVTAADILGDTPTTANEGVRVSIPVAATDPGPADVDNAVDNGTSRSVENPVVPPADAATVDDIPMASPEQRTRLAELLRTTGRDRQSTARTFIAGVIGKKVDGAADLTAEQAGQVIAALQAEIDANQAPEG